MPPGHASVSNHVMSHIAACFPSEAFPEQATDENKVYFVDEFGLQAYEHRGRTVFKRVPLWSEHFTFEAAVRTDTKVNKMQQNKHAQLSL